MKEDKRLNGISIAALTGLSALILCLGVKCTPSLEQQKQQAKQDAADRILSDIRSHAVMAVDTINAYEYNRLVKKEGNIQGARADSAVAANRIVDIVNNAEIVNKDHNIQIGGMNMGGGLNTEVDTEALAKNPELTQAVCDYHDAVVYLACNCTKNR